MRYLSPADDPWASGYLPVDGRHRLYYEQRGAADGIPVVVVHGGPGSGNSAAHAAFFAADRYRVILADQRGAGRSEPVGRLENNTTADLLADLDRLRVHLGIARWLVVGGSWGATLAVLYAAARPESVRGLLLRNPFLARAADLEWFFGGAKAKHPAAWLAWAALSAPAAPGTMLPWLDADLHAASEARQAALVAAWHGWEGALAGTPARPLSARERDGLWRRYRLQCHYFRQNCFLAENGILDASPALAAAALPVHVVQGLADDVCPAAATRLLLARLPRASWDAIAGVGHDPFAAPMQEAIRAALDCFAATAAFPPGNRLPLA